MASKMWLALSNLQERGEGRNIPSSFTSHPSSPAELRLRVRKTHPEVRVIEPLDVVHVGQSSEAQKRREKGLDFQRLQ